ncbi:NYN domain-containing protein [Kaistia terrae]|uniref:NYN domain-containing protein n=1 Tax=Kaistia terrae TaxID=537017 RepID=A0ABW0Q1D7_9HYPH|nr:NYN domain-containing protein [Kaistia terrae]MCX5579876.1 NYN domain-containing protein [Kaistia terrae]
MTAPIKSVLFVDYDSLYLSLRARDPGMARRFALRPGVWLEAIEAGLLLEPRGEEATRRRILMRRCYADPTLLGKARTAFTGQGFQIVDCPPLPGRERNSAEIHMVLDTIDALAHQTGFEEFILLSADSDLTPVIYRLRSYNRATTIYTTLTTSAGYRAIADGVLDEQALITLLAPTADAESPEATEDAEEENAQVRANGGERDSLAGLARRVHQATNVPLFSPRVYSELFRALTREVSENGYHFQTTAENVAARLTAHGRNASRRQIAFVVKGLALKGHIFSTSDSPEKLAEAFKEQVLYLARNAGVEINESMESLIDTWIVGREAAPAIAALPPPTPTPEPPVATAAPERAAARPIPSAPAMPGAGSGTAPAWPRPAVARPDAPQPSPQRVEPTQPQAPQPAPREARPISLQPISATMPQPVRPIQVHAIAEPSPQPVAPPAVEAAPVERAPRPAIPPAAPVLSAPPQAPPPQAAIRAEAQIDAPQPASPLRRTQVDPESLLAEISSSQPAPRANIAPPRARAPKPFQPEAAVEPAPTPNPIRPPAPRSSAGTAVVMRPPARRIAVTTSNDTSGERDPIESSILAAIAQAVDVLVDDGEQPEAPAPAPAQQANPQPQRPARIAAPAPAPEPVQSPADAGEDNDIGDEIQRILAAYSQNRKPGGR